MITLADGRTILLAPEDDVRGAILAMLNGAQHEILLQMYALTLVPAVDAMIAKHQAGVDVALVLDSSQAGVAANAAVGPEAYSLAYPSESLADIAIGGSPEAAQILRLKSAGVPMVIGQSSAGSILHEKAVVVDHDSVGYGSFNWSLSASLQTNCWVTETNAAVAGAFRAAWLSNWLRLGGAPRS